MSGDLAIILSKVKNLSREELVALQEHVSGQLNATASINKTQDKDKQATSQIHIAGAYQPRIEDIEASMAAMSTPEELAEMDRIDFDNLPSNGKSLSQMVIEDREDRL